MFDSIEAFIFPNYDAESLDFKRFTNDQTLERDEATKINKLRESFLRAMKSSADFSALDEHGKPYIEALVRLYF